MQSFENILNFFQISNFETEIAQYGNTYREHFADKIMGKAEMELSLREGFYIGHHKTGLGEFLSYTPIPRFLKTYFPGCKVYVCNHRFAKALFRHNKYVDDVLDIPGREPFGTFREFGFGTHPQRRMRSFGIFVTEPVYPEVTISPECKSRWEQWRKSLPLNGRKLILVQSSGRTNPKLFSALHWLRLLWPLRKKFYFVQIGNLRDQFIWAHKIKLRQWDMEDLAAILTQGDAFVGPNSGVMHLAASVNTRAVILHNEATRDEIVLPTLGDNFVLPKKINPHLFHTYPSHYHLAVDKANLLDSDTLEKVLQDACHSPNPGWTKIKNHFEIPVAKFF